MCAQFILKAKLKELAKALGIEIPKELKWNERILPYSQAPVITKEGVSLMQFSLLPFWSKERKVKFATHNARLETITEKATWRTPFKKNHCFIPMNSFIEPIYEGELAGNMVAFNSDEPLYAAGIYDVWTDKLTGEVIDSFAIITSEPSEYVKQVGHDRQPVFLKIRDAQSWISNKLEPSNFVDFIVTRKIDPNLTTTIDRKLKSQKEAT